MAINTEITNKSFAAVTIIRESRPFIMNTARQMSDAALADASGSSNDLIGRMVNFILFLSLIAERIKLNASITTMTIA